MNVSTGTKSICGASRSVAPLRTVIKYRPTDAGKTAAAGVDATVGAAGAGPDELPGAGVEDRAAGEDDAG
eukprot:13811468-Alexandrium_andersonii.AAC.1